MWNIIVSHNTSTSHVNICHTKISTQGTVLMATAVGRAKVDSMAQDTPKRSGQLRMGQTPRVLLLIVTKLLPFMNFHRSKWLAVANRQSFFKIVLICWSTIDLYIPIPYVPSKTKCGFYDNNLDPRCTPRLHWDHRAFFSVALGSVYPSNLAKTADLWDWVTCTSKMQNTIKTCPMCPQTLPLGWMVLSDWKQQLTSTNGSRIVVPALANCVVTCRSRSSNANVL